MKYLEGILFSKEERLRKVLGEAVNKGGPIVVGLCLDAMTGMAGGLAAMAGGLGELDGMEILKERGMEEAEKPPEWATVYGRYLGEEGCIQEGLVAVRWELTVMEGTDGVATELAGGVRDEPVIGT